MTGQPAAAGGPDGARDGAAPAADGGADIAALARGGRTNFIGFLLRLAARLPFLFIAGRLYGADALGRFASALIIVELAGQLATLGLKRGLAKELSRGERTDASVVADGLMVSGLLSLVLVAILLAFPAPMFPNGVSARSDLLLPLAILPLALTEVALAALAFRFNIAATVRSRAIVEPWALSIMAGVLWLFPPVREGGLGIAYLISVLAAAVVAIVPLIGTYGLPTGWQPRPLLLGRIAIDNLPLALADTIEWGTRRLDIALLGLFVSPATVGVYYIAQQVASLPQKLKTSFEPILGPVIVRKLRDNDLPAIAGQICQVGFWIIAAQIGVTLALGIPGEAVMGLVGPGFVGGTGALACLLAAEVLGAPAVVSEAALIYLARLRNLVVSIATIGLQALLTVGAILAARSYGLPETFQAAAAALALALALTMASWVRARMLGAMLGQRINTFRWPLVWAAAPAVAVGWLATLLPEWMELVLGLPAIILVYGYVIWRRGFGSEDRVLFRRVREKGAVDGAAAIPAELPIPPAR